VDQFNWDEVSSTIDVASDINGEERVESLRQLTFRMAAISMRDLLDWVDEEFTSKGGVKMSFETSRRIKDTILRNYVRGEGLTCEQIGNRVGIKRSHVSDVKCDFEDRFGVHDAHSKTDEQKEASRKAQLARKN
jgi:predicted HAD superfamily phosphohydrolase